jgi:hypothetical protein
MVALALQVAEYPTDKIWKRFTAAYQDSSRSRALRPSICHAAPKPPIEPYEESHPRRQTRPTMYSSQRLTCTCHDLHGMESRLGSH